MLACSTAFVLFGHEKQRAAPPSGWYCAIRVAGNGTANTRLYSLEEGVAVEIDSAPERLDLTDRHVLAAKEAGLKIVISTDAHRVEQLEWMKYGVGIARRAWLEKSDVLNTLPLKTFLRKLKG